MTTALLFAASVALLVLASELFTNAVEWAGFRLRLGSGATGSLLAAIGTALPETVVPIVALLAHARSADQLAIGAVLGAPFLLLTVGSCVTGFAVLMRRNARTLVVDRRQSHRDLGVFIVAFSASLTATVLPEIVRRLVGVALLVVYAGYVVATLRGSAPSDDMPEPLHFVRWRPGQPHAMFITVQLTVAVGMLVLGSQLFVDALNTASAALGVSALVLALVVVPLATELPETLNSVLWVRSRDDMLAFGNVAGSSTFQACVLGFIGVTFTSWTIGSAGLISAIATLVTALALFGMFWRGRIHGGVLMIAGLPWVGYVIAQVVTSGRLGG